jgi:hypothetical protein
MTLVERIHAVDTKPRPKSTELAASGASPAIAPRLIASPFQIDHRAELIREMRADADELDRRAAHQTALALSLRLSADHLEIHPPE